QFADPDWEPTRPPQKQAGTQQSTPYTPQPVNDDMRERFQQPTLETPSEQNEAYGGLPPYVGTMPEQPRQASYPYRRMPYRRRRRGAWFWIIIAILFFSLLGGGSSALGSIGQRSVTQDHAFPVGGTPTIVINESDGNIHVQRGNSFTIEDVKKSSFFADPNNISVKFNQTGSTITVNVDTGSSFLSSNSVDFNITVPGDANLQLQTTSGDISVSNTNGAMTLATVSGNISTANDTFAPNAVLSTTSGNIDSTGDTFNGEAGFTAVSGDISLDHDTLSGPAKANTTSGNIDFNGTIATSSPSPATYQFNTVSGDIHVGLPSSTSFSVQASTGSGSINADDFPAIKVVDANHGSGSQASGTVGYSPCASLTIRTTNCDITIRQNS